MTNANDPSRLRVTIQGPVATITLARPAVRNAFDERLLNELDTTSCQLAADRSLRVVILAGEGKAFCAGADLDWMRRMADFSFEENLSDAMGLARCLKALHDLPQPLVGRIHGPAIGGGMGLVAVCDIAITTKDAIFGFSEVKLGLSPACISPYVIEKMGIGPCRELFLTGRRFTAEKAYRLGLVNHVVEPDRLDDEVAELVSQLLTSGPEAIASCKDLLRNVPGMPLEEAVPYTAETIARLRSGDEGKEGIRSFLERRTAHWSGSTSGE